jgi:hypothetical protein
LVTFVIDEVVQAGVFALFDHMVLAPRAEDALYCVYANLPICQVAEMSQGFYVGLVNNTRRLRSPHILEHVANEFPPGLHVRLSHTADPSSSFLLLLETSL